MDRRFLVALALSLAAVLVAAGVASVTLAPPRPSGSTPGADQSYPAGAGPDDIDFSALEADGKNVSHAPRDHWDSYAIVFTQPPDRRLVEGDYYVDSLTGEVIADRWHNVTVYRNGSTYAVVQPAADVRSEREREELASDDAYAYDAETDAYYRYDPHYGQLAPTNIGRHTALLEPYTWEATGTATHHGVPVIAYRVTGTRTNVSGVPPAVNGTLLLGAEDGIVYAFDIAVDTSDGVYRYTYEVRPAPFPSHDWVDTAREVTSANGTTNRSVGAGT